jgi:hypothetical protein
MFEAVARGANARWRLGDLTPMQPPEVFDTALALLALAPLRQQASVAELIRQGRSFLVAQQNADGSWPATTRPSGGDSYAQNDVNDRLGHPGFAGDAGISSSFCRAVTDQNLVF